MVATGNRSIPNTHFHKHWNPCSSQKGHVVTHHNQATRAIKRREKRKAKAAKLFPRPACGGIRPVVQCCTQRYNMKPRLGKGFSLLELKEVGLHPCYAASIGIKTDKRRKNRTQEGLDVNVNRLKDYLSKLVIWPIEGKNGKKDTRASTWEERKKSQWHQDRSRHGPVANPWAATAKPKEAPRALTDKEKSRHTYMFLRKVQRDQKLIGIRIKRANKKADGKDESNV
eukprot:NODE_1225_length_1030_cov_589.501529_g850_i0.p2 GENE.NODE_1225_length_1030_cov_589.501529_g850_i0~~NODE_1225_length_1030_cov_589.501529_g850_i0.p2  ORF type:complete len:246 (-),score=86.50 NODE_1225_length_1030_cov_589.501529_g850_i0:292-972(-)